MFNQKYTANAGHASAGTDKIEFLRNHDQWLEPSFCTYSRRGRMSEWLKHRAQWKYMAHQLPLRRDQWLVGLGVWFLLRVREVPGSNPGRAHLCLWSLFSWAPSMLPFLGHRMPPSSKDRAVSAHFQACISPIFLVPHLQFILGRPLSSVD